MKLKKAIAMASCALAMTFGIAACGSSPSKAASGTHKEYKIGLILGDNADPYFLTLWHGAYVEAKKLHVDLIEDAPTSFDYSQEVPLLTDMIAQHVNAIVLSPDSATALNSEIAQAHKAGIPVIVVNQTEKDMNNNPDVLSFITSSNLALSKLAGKEMVTLLHGQGTTAVIDSVAGLTSDIHRGTGFYSYAKANAPNMKVLPMQFSDDSRSKADSIATDLMESHRNLDGIFAVDSFTGQGVGTAVRSAKEVGKVKVIAIDAEPQEVQLMNQGVIQALIAQQPYRLGTLSVQYAYDALTGKKSDIVRSVEPAGIVVTPSNIKTPAMQKVIYQAWHP